MFDALDFLYVPAPDIEAAVHFYVDVLGGDLRWKIHAFNAWVACVRLSPQGPPVLLADHKSAGGPQLVYRVQSLEETMAVLRARGWVPEGEPFGLPPGPCCSFRDPAGNSLAIYECTRPEAATSFEGRFDRT